MRVLAVGCHPDDLEIACGGTLRKYVEQGAEVYMCHIANGNQGHVVIEPDVLRVTRTLEAIHSGAVIGAKDVINLDVPDMEVNSHDLKIMDAMAEVVRKVRPDVIITHNDDDYMLDHKETSIIATNGSFCSGLSHRPRRYDVFNSFVPVFFMDTLAALECHESQLKWMLEHDNIDFADMVRTCSKYRGYQCGVAYAEGFRPYNVYPRYSTRNLLPD